MSICRPVGASQERRDVEKQPGSPEDYQALEKPECVMPMLSQSATIQMDSC